MLLSRNIDITLDYQQLSCVNLRWSSLITCITDTVHGTLKLMGHTKVFNAKFRNNKGLSLQLCDKNEVPIPLSIINTSYLLIHV